MLKYRLDLKIYDEVVEINDEVKSLDKKFDVSNPKGSIGALLAELF